jgi:hypothetical protein
MKIRTLNGKLTEITWRETLLVLLISALVFISFYYNAYFSEDFKGMLGYELKDTLSQLMAFFHASDQGSTLYWDPIYLQYMPRFPQAPLNSPVTLFLLLVHRIYHFSDFKVFLGFLLVVLALIQVFCVYTMYLFLRYCGFNLTPSVFGGLAYAYNHQTFVFGIKHGYERISAVLLAPLFLLSFFKLLQGDVPKWRRRMLIALTALLLGISFISNGDVKPTFYFAIFMVIAVLFIRPFRKRNIGSLLIIFALAGIVFLVQACPTLYALREMGRGQESIASIMDYSMRPFKFVLTTISTKFTDYPAYPWENTVEFSLPMMLLAFVGAVHLFRHRLRMVFLVTIIVSIAWIMGKYTPLAPILGWFMKLFALRHPTRMAMLLYFCYAFLIALGLQYLQGNRFNRLVVLMLSPLLIALAALFFCNPGMVPLRYLICAALSYLVIFAVTFKLLPRKAIWLILLFFTWERATFFSTLEGSNRGDPTKYYTYDEIYSVHPRVKAILTDPDYKDYRAFFGVKDFPYLFSHNFYLNAFFDGIRPVFANFYLDEELLPVRQFQEVIFSDWSNPGWDLLNVKYLVDLDKYFAAWDEEDTSKKGLEHLKVVDKHVRINPGAEKEIFLRYRAELTDDQSFLKDLGAGKLDVKKIAYLNSADADPLNQADLIPPKGEEEINIIRRKPDAITVEVTVPRAAIVVFSEFWFFPWRVEVDGRKAPLLRTYNILQGVKVPAGKHRVRFYFNSRHWKFVLPFIFSYGLIFFLIVYIIYAYFQRRKISGITGSSS